ncbi:MAG TPA: FixH family protein [Kofleriaceae bacterium]|nr:FixH family protein [Kofleriaceae bacterium]
MKAIVVAAVGLLAACGGDDGEGDDVDCTMVTGADTFVVGLEKHGTGGTLDFKLMSATPSPPARGDNNWVVQINSMASGVVGAPVDGAMLQVTPFMPAHQHGSPIAVTIAPGTNAGEYNLTPVNLWMPGVWETTIRATSGSTTDSAVYKFCIE